MLRTLYMSRLGGLISACLNSLSVLHRPFMVYGYNDKPSGKWRKLTRFSSNAVLSDRDQIAVGDNVWIWHHSIIDGSQGVTIGDGTQIGAWVGIFSHGSQVAIRLYGAEYIAVDKADRIGYTRAPVEIGEYCFVGAGAVILPGTVLGSGCLVAAGSVVNGKFPPFSVVKGNPAKVVGDTRQLDTRYFGDENVRQSYFDQDAMNEWLAASESARRLEPSSV